MRYSRWVPWCFLAIVVVIGCGTDICVGPFPTTCYEKDSEGSSTSGTLLVTSPRDPVGKNETITFSVTGGVAPYSFRQPLKGNMSQTGVFVTPTEQVAILIEVVDSRAQVGSTAISVQ